MLTHRHLLRAVCAAALMASAASASAADRSGPYNYRLVAGGDSAERKLGDAPIAAASAWSLSGWVEPATAQPGRVMVAGLGEPDAGVFLGLDGGVPTLVVGGRAVSGGGAIAPGRRRLLAAISDGRTVRLFVDGAEVAHADAPATDIPATLSFGGRTTDATPNGGFAGTLAGFTFRPSAMSASDLRAEAAQQPDLLTVYTDAAPTWPVQTRQMAGQVTPQDPWTRPKSAAPFSKPVAKPMPNLPALAATATNRWTVNGWRLAEAPKVADAGPAVSKTGYDARSWYAATVPGTVLTTLVDRGVYPEPDYGLNNTIIPESLHDQDYWYRTEIDVPASAQGKHLFLNFKGINYRAEIWVNGQSAGTITGAFIRGRFDVTGKLVAGQKNAVAVRISPPPHPGVAHEESLTAGVGENGGMQMLDGPTFEASEGWDWIPSVRDRNTGLWQGVVLEATGDVAVGDSQVVTTLPKGDTTQADVEIDVPVTNLSDRAVTAEVGASFDGVTVSKAVPLAPRASATVKLTPAEFAQLSVANPKLWWPNGYGAPALHSAHVTASVDGAASDAKDVRFGMRQVTYELSLFDTAGNLRRVEIDLSKARALNQQIVDYRHEAIRKVPGQWAASLMPGAESSPAVKALPEDKGLSPYLVIKVNGVRIAARGGAWGTDDWRKRVDRAKLEPYFKLHQDAHVNIIRNWVGQNTEENFYDLADEYGMMVVNDFWESTQNYNIEAEDVPLFEANAADVIQHYRNHPSIILWFGRNEGVPQPILNTGLESLVNNYDGTRIYLGSSNTINLHDSGPYNWRQPADYFTKESKGFAVEVGTPSFPTLESWKRWIPGPDQWPISDSWAYHDWHQTGNGAVKTFTDQMVLEFGQPTSLADFEKKAQMLEYESYRAIFEGMNAELWTRNSGRMLWMTQPAWPSSAWQMFSSDYDTHGAFYGVKKASEPVHVQMNLPDHKVILVNNEQSPRSGMTVHAQVFALDGSKLDDRTAKLDIGPGTTAEAFTLDLASSLASKGVVLVKLEATDGAGTVVSHNVYWQGRDDAALTALNGVGEATVGARAGAARRDGGEVVVPVTIGNPGKAPAIQTKLTLFDAAGNQVLPAYFSDNYVSLLPGDSRVIEVRYPAAAAKGRVSVALRGYNVKPARVALPGAR